jgi:hypothetical protein
LNKTFTVLQHSPFFGGILFYKTMLFFLLCAFLQAGEISLKETLARIQKMISREAKGAYFCFYETDARIACGQRGSIWDQLEMERMLSLSGDNILKSRLLPYGALNGNRPNEKWAANLFRKIEGSWNDSHASLSAAFLSTSCRNDALRFFRFLQSQPLLILSDTEIPRSTLNLLFGSNFRFEVIENENVAGLDAYTVVVYVGDSSAKGILMHWLEQENPVFVLDLSGLRDALADWSFDAWERWLKRKDEFKILYTSALIPLKFEERKKEYIQCLQILRKFDALDRTYIVESGPYTPLSFFEEFTDRVFYANTNDPSMINKGANEAKACLAAFDYFDFQDEEMIVKLTGRYLFNSDEFLRFVATHPEADAIGSPHAALGIMTGCFAMRGKHYKRMLRELDFTQMELELIDIERIVERWFKKMAAEGAKVIYLDKIGITANVANVSVEQW